jgi:hypothetical protein
MAKSPLRKSASIDEGKLKQIVLAVRRTAASMSPKQRLVAVEAILRAADIIQEVDVEQLVCIRHAKELRKYRWHSSIYWLAEKGKIKPYRICCRDFLSRRELESLPDAGLPAATLGNDGHHQIKVKRR